MSRRVHNFGAGPCTLPLQVLQEAQEEFVDFQGAGMSLIEMSHRSKEYDAVHREAMRLASDVFGAPEEFEVLFIQGGASLQFAMVPMNLLKPGRKAGYVNSGAWAKNAIRDAGFHGDIYTAWDGADADYLRMPASHEIEIQADTRYLHITSNETIGGIRMSEWPDVGVPMVADLSSEYMARPIPWEKFDLVYGGIQKNLGPAGMAVVFVRASVLADTNREIASYLRYDAHADKQSLFNTPPMFAVYLLGKMLKWMQAKGGLAAVEQQAAGKAAQMYGVIDASEGFYRCPVAENDRSHMNVVFRLPDESLEAKFLNEAAGRDLVNLKGHRSVGGCRASIYNAMPEESVTALADFMRQFASNNS